MEEAEKKGHKERREKKKEETNYDEKIGGIRPKKAPSPPYNFPRNKVLEQYGDVSEH